MGLLKLPRSQNSGLSERLGAARAAQGGAAPEADAPAPAVPAPTARAGASMPPPPPGGAALVAPPPPGTAAPSPAGRGWTDVDAPAAGGSAVGGPGSVLGALGDAPVPSIPAGSIVAMVTIEGDQATLLQAYDEYEREHPRPPVGQVLHLCLPVKEGITLIDVWRGQQFLDAWLAQGGGANPKVAKIHAVRTGA